MHDDDHNYLVRATAHEGRVRAFAVNSTNVVAELMRRHGTAPAVTAALGRLSTGALVLGAMLKKPDQLVTVRIDGGGPAGVLLASANGRGEVRGLVSNPRPDIDQVRNGKLNVAGVVGTRGRLTVTRDLGMRQPYNGMVELVSGEVSTDLANYLARSEQIPSAVGIGVFVRADGSVEAAGGYVVQILPGLADSDVTRIEDGVRALPHPTTMLRAGETPERILHRIFPHGFQLQDRLAVRFHCPCSRERAERALLLLGPQALAEIQEKDTPQGETEVVCEFCTARYCFSTAEIAELARIAAPPAH